MRKFWLSTASAVALVTTSLAAQAADLPRKAYAPPPVIVPPYSWTGFYLGGNIGGAWLNTHITDAFTTTSFGPSGSGFIGGGQLGYNWQFNGPWVVGVEWDFDWTSHGSNNVTAISPLTGNVISASTNPQWVTTVAGRFGYAVDTWLFYLKGGGGWVNTKWSVLNQTTGVGASGSHTNSGWLFGVGVEYAFARNWSAKLEYDYLGLTSWSNTGPFAPIDTINASGHLQMIKAGINYKFGTY